MCIFKFKYQVFIIFECKQILQLNLQNMWSVSTVNLAKKLLQFQRYQIYPRELPYLVRPVYDLLSFVVLMTFIFIALCPVMFLSGL